VCVGGVTDKNGKVTFVSQTTSNTPPAIYTYVLYCLGNQVTSTVAVKPTSAITLQNYKVDYILTTALNDATMLVSKRVSPLGQTISKTIKQAVVFGYEVGKSYLSNPGNLVLVAFTIASCTAGQSVPAAGQTLCAVSVKMVALGIAKETAKVIAKKVVDAQSWTTTTKNQVKGVIDLASAAISFAMFKPGSGLEDLVSVTGGWTFGSGSGQLIYSGTTLKGASLAAPINDGSGRVLQISVYNR